MFASKKAVEPYLIILGVVSVLMGLFLLVLFSTFYGSESEKCFALDYEIKEFCKAGGEVIYEIENNAGSILRFQVNGVNSEQIIEPFQESELRFSYGSVEQVTFVPIVNEGVETLQCRSKLKKDKVSEIQRC